MMMNKTILLLLVWALCSCTEAQTRVSLPAPNAGKASKMTLMQALQNRHSVREYADKVIPDATLSTLLWAACGYNRPAEKRITAPSAMNVQDISVYVCRADGAYRYNPDKHALDRVSSKDLRASVASRQDFVKTAPVCLVLVSDLSKFRSPDAEMGALDAGYVSENICLACTALGLCTVPRATMDRETLTRELGLQSHHRLFINHPIGWPKK